METDHDDSRAIKIGNNFKDLQHLSRGIQMQPETNPYFAIGSIRADRERLLAPDTGTASLAAIKQRSSRIGVIRITKRFSQSSIRFARTTKKNSVDKLDKPFFSVSGSVRWRE